MPITTAAQALSSIKPPLFKIEDGTTGSDNAIGIIFPSGISTSASGIAVTSASQLGSGHAAFLNYTQPNINSSNYIYRIDLVPRRTTSVYGASRGWTSILCDIVWFTTGLSMGLGVQTINSVELPPRDLNEQINGVGLIPMLSVVSTLTTAGGNTIISYTNSEGVSGRTCTVVFPQAVLGNTSQVGELQQGDIGIKSIETLEFTVDHGTGSIVLMLLRPLTIVTAFDGKTVHSIDTLYLPKIFNNTVLFPITMRAQSGIGNAMSIYLTEG